jgi:[glutamine synthetase] adenylyltransferase / [glutamine synthetase]-adenylyl-L-tyrosine phosphorylase
MNFADQITRTPHTIDADSGDEALTALSIPTAAHALIRGAAGSSPYLRTLILRWPDWLNAAMTQPPGAVLRALLKDVAAIPDADLGPGLRHAKGKVALWVALADLGGVWPLERVTGALTDFADAAVGRSLTSLVAAEVKRGKLPGQGPNDVADAAGMVVLAMGKAGAGELNYSSDIDLICLFDDERYADDYAEARAAFIRVTRRMAALLSEPTGDGYVFRTDLRLRPDPSVTPVCLSMDAAERYYESLGRPWERAALIKARVMAGDQKAGQGFLDRLSPFVWRKHLDYATIDDAHDIRQRIRRARKPVSAGLDGRNIKLDPGGIREIEFFTQTQQLIAGGRDETLRVRGTVDGLDKLATAGWIDRKTADQLTADYRAHRDVEHRLQMVNDLQTHLLPNSDEGWQCIAALSGLRADDLKARIAERITRVAETTEGFFAPSIPDAPAPDASGLGDQAEEIIARWASYPALRSSRAADLFERIRPALQARLAQASDPAQAVLHLDGFLSGLPAGVQLFSLFEANPQLLDLIVDIADTAPELARYLSQNAGVLDAVIGGDFFAPWPGAATLQGNLTATLDRLDDYELQLDATRRWFKEWHFRVGVHHLRGLIAPEDVAKQYADLAQASVAALWPVVQQEFSRRHGVVAGAGCCVLAMGSLGAGLLHSASDLDMIVIYDAPKGAESDGKRALPARTYFARATQALVTALSAPTAEGRLYEVDMRLRPSGKQGPVATSISAFADYQRTEAWTWEHLALMRARPIAGDADVCAGVAAIRAEVLSQPRDAVTFKADVAAMRGRIKQAKSGGAPLDLKDGSGRLQDIELAAAAAALFAGSLANTTAEHLADATAAGVLSGTSATTLGGAHALFLRLRLSTRLVFGASNLEPGRGERLVLAGLAVADFQALPDHLAETATAARLAIEAFLET